MTENVFSLRPWDASLRRAKSRASDLLRRDDLPAVIQGLSPLEAYTAVKALGPTDAAPVLACLTPEQVKTLWDLEGWHAHRLSIPDLTLWLSAFREASLEAMQRAAHEMDFETLSVLLRRRLLVATKPREDRSEEELPPEWLLNPTPDIEPLVETPDGRFIIAARLRDEDEDEAGDDGEIDEEDRKWIVGFVRELYQQDDWESVAAALRSAAADLTSSLEEDAYRFRTARLEDLGFPPRERAIEIYGLLDPQSAAATAAAPVVDLPLPAAYAPPLQEGLFHSAMQSIDDPAEMRRLEGDLVAVANKALVADGVTPGQTDAMQDVLHRMRGYIEIALAEGVEPSRRLEEAKRRLQHDHFERLFRIGYTLTVRAAGRARRLLQHAALGEGGPDQALRRLSTAEQGVIEALLLRRPRVSGALDPLVAIVQTAEQAPAIGEAAAAQAPAVGLDPGAAEARRPFSSFADLIAVRWVLDDLEQLLEAWASHAPERPPLLEQVNLPPEEQTLDLELTTAAANVMIGRAYAVVPLSMTDLADLADRVTLSSHGAPRFAEDAVVRAVAAAGGAPIEDRLRRQLVLVAEQLWARVGEDTVDPRFVDAVLTSVGS